MARRNIGGSRAIVTGASSGIGRAMALELARQGGKVLVTARRRDRLEEVVDEIQSTPGEAFYVAGDVTEARTRKEILRGTESRLGGLDILVNNAGIGAIGPFETASAERLREVMEVNFFAPLELTRAAMPLLLEGRQPIIVNVGSVLGHRAVPKKSEYCASKFAMHGFSDALRAELAHRGIDVLLVSPSTTSSEFFDHVISSEPAKKVTWRKLGAMRPEKVARKAIRAIRTGKHEIILSAGGRLLVALDRLWPRLANWITMRFG